MEIDVKKSHHKKRSGSKADKKKHKDKDDQNLHVSAKQRNPKAFAVQSVNKTAKLVQRTLDIKTKKHHIPLVDRTPIEPPPVVVAIVGPPKVGKSTLLQCLVKNFTKQKLSNPQGPVTVVSGKNRRLTVVECNNDINSMIDVAKIADLVLLLVDASFGFEMEIFEFLNICQVHGFPRIMGVLTHLDSFKDNKRLKKTKKRLKHRFWTEVYQGAKLFYLSGMVNGEYQKREVHNLCRFISVMKFRPLTWRLNHPYVLADRVEDITEPGLISRKPKADRNVSLYGYVRGTHFKNQCNIHIPGCGDYKIHDVHYLPDPCPTPNSQKKKRSLNEKERLIYAPMSGVGGVVYDKDAVYIDLGGSHSHREVKPANQPTNDLVSSMMRLQQPMDDRMTSTTVSLFSNTEPLTELNTFEKSTDRRPWLGLDEDDDDSDSGSDSDDDTSDEEMNEDDDADNDDLNNFISTNDTEQQKDMDTEPAQKKSKLSLPKERLSFADSDDDLENEDEIKLFTSQTLKSTEVNEKKSTQNTNKPLVKSRTRQSESGTDNESDSSDDEILLKNSDSQTSDQLGGKSPKSSIDSDSDNSDSSGNESRSDSNRDDNESECVESNVNNYKKVEKDDSSGSEDTDNESSDENSSDEDGSDNKSDVNLSSHIPSGPQDVDMENKEDEETESQIDEEKQLSGELKWKSNMVERAAEGFRQRQTERINYRKLVYGQEEAVDEDAEDSNELGGLFTVLKKKSETSKFSRIVRDGLDCSRIPDDLTTLSDIDELIESIRDCFVTGKWDKSEDAETLLKQDDEMFGDFEDLETGETFKGEEEEKSASDGDERENETGEEQERVKKKAELTATERRERKKQKLKERFDNEYDLKDDDDFYEEWKTEMEGQAKLNREEFEKLPDELRVQYEGFRPGMYVRVEIKNVPCEFVTNFDPSYPVILGGLQNVERNVGYVQVRIKKHRWHKKILKTRNPLIISLGWRRFQSIPLYSIQDHNYRNRLLKYTPEHLHCHASFWGPITPQGTGLLAVESVSEIKAGFRIAATGVVLELDKSIPIVKKLKLTGEPLKIFKKTAFVKGMFSSKLEVAKFEGASIRTVSGVRGQIKKALSTPEGAFRATFEDRILMSDIVFVRTWFNVDVPQFYNPVTTLLLPQEEKARWIGMKTVGQLRRERGLRGPLNKDSLYKPVTRIVRAPQKMVIPRKLQKELPFTDTPKLFTPQKPDPFKRVSVIREPREAKVAKMMQMLKTLHEHKLKKVRVAMRDRASKHQKEQERVDQKKMQKQKEVKKEIYRVLGQIEKKKNKNSRS